MRKVSIVGPERRLDAVIEQLHEMQVLHIDDYTDEDGELDIGSPQEPADELSDTLVQLRSVRSELPAVSNGETPDKGRDIDEQIDELRQRLDELQQERGQVAAELDEKEAVLETLRAVERLGLDLDDVQEYRSLDIYVGRVADFQFTDEIPDGRYELYRDGHAIALFVDTGADVADTLRESGFDEIDITPVQALDGDISGERERLRDDIRTLEQRQKEIEQELNELARTWRGYLDEKEYELAAELEKAEAPLQFAVTDHTFFAQGWIPDDTYDDVVRKLDDVTDGRIHIETLEEDDDEAPVKHDNPQGVNHFESLLQLYGTPSYKEIDPTFLLLTFPLLFGFMLGDIGYGLTGFALFYAMYRRFPEAEGLWKSMMFASVTAVIFGLLYGGETFGFHLFGEHSDLTAATGIHLFEELPIIFDRPHRFGAVMMLSVLIGVVHVNLGILVGFYNEYIRHGLLEAVFAKLSWLVIQAGVAVYVLASMGYEPFTGLGTVGGAVALIGVVMLYRGEHVEGVVEIPSLLSNVLSYLRILGVSIAVVALAKLVNELATPLFQSGSILYILLGVGVLVVGHAINTFIKLMEAGLQGIRLHYVEFFTKFFHGGGEYYRPFGVREQ